MAPHVERATAGIAVPVVPIGAVVNANRVRRATGRALRRPRILWCHCLFLFPVVMRREHQAPKTLRQNPYRSGMLTKRLVVRVVGSAVEL